ncbi:hypothetical protein RUESEDTHA_01564 [Ruegeria sp. THAF57]|uniref:hypothetical protein n=1 Tax=Ruegeria sp. THAF57 TaxID=2744555 RepID=UPI0015E00C3B|nr:hypothetical protein [Ruegeria sp. THAF57]CAD0184682.1 hypothetical protein RUESEDTHA_01564 [Ruegeria sp. THAF57]
MFDGGLLSWSTALAICTSAVLVVLLGDQVVAFGGIAAVAGFSAGFLGSVFSSPVSSVRTFVMVLMCILVCTLFPLQWIAFLCGFFLISWAAYEGCKNGGFATVPALNGLLLYLLIPPDERIAILVLVFFAAAIVGSLLCVWLNLAGSATRPPMSFKEAFSIWLFLIVGMSLTSFLAHVIGNQKSYWLSLLFVFRVLAPLQKVPVAALRFGVGVALGSLAALCLEFSGLSHQALLILGFASAVIGVHKIGGNTLWTAMYFTIATLLVTAPTMEFAVFRIEAAAMIVFVVGALSFLISWCWERIESRSEN